MIVRLKYADMKGNALKGGVNGKAVNCFMRVEVDNTNINEAIAELRGNKWVVSLDFVGDIEYLNMEGMNFSGVNVIVKVDLSVVSAREDEVFSLIPEGVRLVIKLPDGFSDMRVVYAYSIRYPNVRFCGGSLLRLQGCNLGCICEKDVFKKIPHSKISLTTLGCACVYESFDLYDLDIAEFYIDSKSRNRGAGVGGGQKRKKQLSSLLELARAKDLSNF